jgi:hypothetical protein
MRNMLIIIHFRVLFNDAVRLYGVEWRDDRGIGKGLEGSGRDLICLSIRLENLKKRT